jgi:hypothetical protein
MTDKKKLKGIKDAVRTVILYPKKGVDPRRTNDGYPLEVVYDVFAYKRMVKSYRDALRNILRDYR